MDEIKKVEPKGKYDYSTGRRKEAIARVRVYSGTGNIIVNGKTLNEYFTNKTSQQLIVAPLKLLGLEKKHDLTILVLGGGKSGQVDAIAHAIARALVVFQEEFRTTLRRAGYLTRDPRVKERKKYGLKRARKAPQFAKR